MGIVSRLFGRKSRLRLAGGGCIQLTDMLAQSGSWEATNRNVVRLDKRGRVVWRIETAASPDERIPYAALWAPACAGETEEKGLPGPILGSSPRMTRII